MKVEIRGATRYLRDKLGIGSSIAEIGVRKGKHAQQIMQDLKPERLYLVDHYLPYQDYKTYLSSDEQEITMREMLERLNVYKKNIAFIKKPSKEASLEIEDGSLDYVYIDGGHDYDSVKQDIESWYGKVKVGGYFGGHDYHEQDYCLGVKKAVDEFIHDSNLPLEEFESQCDWLIKKI